MNRRRACAVFQEETKSNLLAVPTIKAARQSGELNLYNKGLVTVPENVWSINEAQDFDKHDVSHFGGDREDPSWWEHKDLFRLTLAANKLSVIPAQLQKLAALTYLDIHDNQLSSLPDVFDSLPLLSTLNVSRNRISLLPDSLYKLNNLHKLNLQHNQLEVLHEDIGDLNCLTHLDISNNKLLELPAGVGWLTNMRSLNLSQNNISSLPQEISSLLVLQTLDVSDNNLTEFPDCMCSLIHLEVLNASQNKITALFTGDSSMVLKEFRVGGNCIKCIPEEFLRVIPDISILDLRENLLTELPEGVCELRNLNALILTNNSLKTIPNSIGTLPNLNCLQLDGNGLRSIRRDILQRGTVAVMAYLKSRIVQEVPPSPNSNLSVDAEKIRYSNTLHLEDQQLTDIKTEVFEEAAKGNVRIVNLSKNKFTNVPEGLNLLKDSLEQLIINRNLLAYIPETLAEATRLLYINLEANKLTALPQSLGSLPNLRELNLSYNRLSTIPDCIFDMKALEILQLNNNQINMINTEGLSKCKLLTVLSLSDNNISNIPPQLGLITQLRSLSLEGNPFRVPRRAILEKGTEAVLSYLRDRIVS